jgi:hypothetical protein
MAVGGSPNTRPPVTTDSPQVPERTRMVSGDLDGVTAGPGSGSLPGLPIVAPLAQTEEGAAAVESVTGLRSGTSGTCPEGSAPSGGLRGILELMSSDAVAAADGLFR